MFGTELVKGKGYVFTTGAKVAVFTWQGCVIELRGKTDVSYVAKETPVVSLFCDRCDKDAKIILCSGGFGIIFSVLRR